MLVYVVVRLCHQSGISRRSFTEMCVELFPIVFIKLICNICFQWWEKCHQTYQPLVRHF